MRIASRFKITHITVPLPHVTCAYLDPIIPFFKFGTRLHITKQKHSLSLSELSEIFSFFTFLFVFPFFMLALDLLSFFDLSVPNLRCTIFIFFVCFFIALCISSSRSTSFSEESVRVADFLFFPLLVFEVEL